MSELDGDGAPGGCARPATGIGAVCVLVPPAFIRIDTLDVSGRPPSEPRVPGRRGPPVLDGGRPAVDDLAGVAVDNLVAGVSAPSTVALTWTGWPGCTSPVLDSAPTTACGGSAVVSGR